MNQFELIKDMAARSGQSETVCARVLDAMRLNWMEHLSQGGSVSLRSLGSLHMKVVSSRVIKLPQTQQPITIPQRKKIVFRASQTLKHAVI